MAKKLFADGVVKFNAGRRSNFCRAYIQNGACCTVLSVHPNTATVRFDGVDETDIVSLAYLKKGN